MWARSDSRADLRLGFASLKGLEGWIDLRLRPWFIVRASEMGFRVTIARPPGEVGLLQVPGRGLGAVGSSRGHTLDESLRTPRAHTPCH